MTSSGSEQDGCLLLLLRKEEDEESYFPLFQEMAKIPFTPWKRLWEQLGEEQDDKECCDVFLYQMVRYPPTSTPPAA